MESKSNRNSFNSSMYEQILIESPVDEDEYRPEVTNPGRVPDLSFLSANFSSESLHNDLDGAPATPLTTAYNTLVGNGPSSQDSTALGNPATFTSQPNFPYGSKRLSFSGSNTSLINSPTAPVGQASFSHHQRAGSSSASSRPRPRSFFGGEPTNNPIHESPSGSPFQDSGMMSAPGDLDRSRNRHSAQFSRRGSYTPTANLYLPAEPRNPRSRTGSPSRGSSPVRPSNTSPYRPRASSPSKKQPFNFKPQDLSVPGSNSASSSLVAKPAHRKGHRYKHSSVSMNLFQEPVPIADANQQPNLIPDSFPIPNFRESVDSASKSQRFKLIMSLIHSVTSVIVFIVGAQTSQPAFSTLAHLVFYDSLGSLMASCVDIMSNFEVWGKSSIAYPFGLGRLEVLTSFALSTSSVMVGCDLISHFVEELVVGYVDPSLGGSAEHGAHHIHGSKDHGFAGWVLYELILLWVLAVTWITSICIFESTPLSDLLVSSNDKSSTAKNAGLLNAQASTSKKMTLLQRLRNMSKILVQNPIRLLTLLYATFLSAVPLIPDHLKEQSGFDLNESSTLVVASLLCYAGWNLVKTLGGILLISFPYSDYDFSVTKSSIHERILNLASFKSSYSIEQLHFTKASPKLYLAGISVCMKGGSSDDESRLIFEINRIIVETMKSFESDCQVETTISANRL